jgi:Uma2 family endonuclease
MSVSQQEGWTLDRFLAWERRQELRHEFDGAQPRAMNGGTVAHSIIASNIFRSLDRRLSGSACHVFRGDVKILANGRVRYPDGVVTCAALTMDSDILPEPVVVFEVLSKSTAGIDRIIKNEEYRATRSIQRYVMLEQSFIGATVFARPGDTWSGSILSGAAILSLPEIGVDLPLEELYAGVELTGPED